MINIAVTYLSLFFISVVQVGKKILFGRRPDVVFYYPQHFNRSAEGKNPFFAPLIKLCKYNGINYLVIEESDPGCNYPSDSSSIKGDAIFWFVWLMHKIHTRFMRKSLFESDRLTGRILNHLTFGKLKAKTYITISNSMVDVLGDINPHGNVYDFQHGIIYRGHPGYFKSPDTLRETLTITNRRALLWGNLYKKNLSNLPHGIDTNDKFIVVGYPLYKNIPDTPEEMGNPKGKNIMISLQFTTDINPIQTQGIVDMLDEFVDAAVQQGYMITLKHHPRFAGEADLTPIIKKHPDQIKFSTAALEDLARVTRLHVTWGSTTAMEYAAYGVPTLFLRDHRFDWATEMFYGQYSYPLYDGMTPTEVLAHIESDAYYQADCKTIKDWYESAYSPLDRELLLKILKGEIYCKNPAQ